MFPHNCGYSLHTNPCTIKMFFLPPVFAPRSQEALTWPVCAHHAISAADFNEPLLLQLVMFKAFYFRNSPNPGVKFILAPPYICSLCDYWALMSTFARFYCTFPPLLARVKDNVLTPRYSDWLLCAYTFAVHVYICHSGLRPQISITALDMPCVYTLRFPLPVFEDVQNEGQEWCRKQWGVGIFSIQPFSISCFWRVRS